MEGARSARGRPDGPRTNAAADDDAARALAVVRCAADAVLTTDRRGVLTSWNAAAEQLFGYPAAEAVGLPVALLVPANRAGEERAILARAWNGERIAEFETERVRRDGSVIDVSLTLSPLPDAAGRIVGAAAIVRDVRGRQRGERRLRRLQAVTAALAQALTAGEVVDVVLGQGFAAFGAAAGVVSMLDTEAGTLEVVGSVGYEPELIGRWGRVGLTDPLPLAEAARTGQALFLPDVAAAVARFPGAAERFGIGSDHALAALPLDVRGRTIGAIGLRFAQPGSFDGEDQEFMRTLARQCSLALDRGTLFGAEREARAEAEEAGRRAEYLAGASRLLGTSLDPANTLEQVARLAVPEVADCALVLTRHDDDTIAGLAVHADPRQEEVARALVARYPSESLSRAGADVLRGGLPVLWPDVSDAMLVATAVDDEHLRLLRALRPTSTMIVPLRARGRTLGAIVLISCESHRRYDEDDLAMTIQLAERCALALDNAQLFAERAEIAQTLQRSLLPARLPTIPGAQLGVRYQAAGRANEVGGDFYDAFAVGRDWILVTGDVVGKGAAAAAITGLARHTIRAAAHARRTPSAILRLLNAEMLDQLPELSFCTVACGRLELLHRGARLTLCCAGHPLPLVVGGDGAVRGVGRHGQPLGLFADPALEDATITLAPDDAVVFYTDGVVEGRDGVSVYGEARLRDLLREAAQLPAAALARRIEHAATAFQLGSPRDDIAILALRLDP